MERKTFYDMQKEEYKKNIEIKKVTLNPSFYFYKIKVKIIDKNRIIKKHTLTAYFICVPDEKELDNKVKNELEAYIYLRIKDKCACYVESKYNEKL